MNEEKEDERPDFMAWKAVKEKRDRDIYQSFLESGENVNYFSIEISRKYKNCCRQNIRKIILDQKLLNEK